MPLEWICIGAGPSADSRIERALREHPQAATVACNAGALLVRPDYYFLADRVACIRWRHVARAYQQLGTKLMTLRRGRRALEERDTTHFDLFLEPGDFVFSGIWIVQWAAAQAASAKSRKPERPSVYLVGMDGYRSKPESPWIDSFMGLTSKASGLEATQKIMRPMYQRIAGVYSDVRFFRYGQAYFQIDAPNWTEIG